MGKGRCIVTDFWWFGPSAAALALRRMGCSPRDADRLVALKLRQLRGDLELTEEQKRLRFARWLVRHGRIGEGRAR